MSWNEVGSVSLSILTSVGCYLLGMWQARLFIKSAEDRLARRVRLAIELSQAELMAKWRRMFEVAATEPTKPGPQ